MINELSHNLIKFRSILIKLYFIDNTFIEDQKPILNNSTLMLSQISHLKTLLVEISYSNIAPVLIPPTKIFIIKKLLALLIPLVSLILVKRGCGQAKKYLNQANIGALLDICFLMNKFNIFINQNNNKKLAQYIASK